MSQDVMNDNGASEIVRELSPFVTVRRGDWELGRIGDYSLLHLIGTGGMAAVFLAINEVKYAAPVALKCVLPHLLNDKYITDRFQREVGLMSKLDGDRFVRLLDSGSVNCPQSLYGMPYYCMDYVAGRTLRQKLDVWRRLPQLEVARIGKEIAIGLCQMHANEILHRDLKPSNVLLDSERRESVRIADFGLGFHEEFLCGDDLSLNRIVGTFQYLAPERWDGDRASGAKADLFSLGCILYESLTGQKPFSNEPFASVREEPCHPREYVSGLDLGLCDIVMQLIEKEPDKRFASSQHCHYALQFLMRSLASGRSSTRIESPSISSEQIRRCLHNLGGACSEIPAEWCHGRSGLLIGLERRLQMSSEMHKAAARVIDALLMTDSDWLREAPSESGFGELQSNLDKMAREYKYTCAGFNAFCDGLSKFREQLVLSSAAMERASEELLPFVEFNALQTKRGRKRLQEGVRKLLSEFVVFRMKFVEDHNFVLDRLIAIIEHLERGEAVIAATMARSFEELDTVLHDFDGKSD